MKVMNNFLFIIAVLFMITGCFKDLFFIKKGSIRWHENTPHSKCVKIKNANHILNQDNPEEFHKTLFDFLYR